MHEKLFEHEKWKCHICGSKLLVDENNGYTCYITYCPKCDKDLIEFDGEDWFAK